MPTLQQLLKCPRVGRTSRSRTPAFDGNPYKRGNCLKVFIISPKKPNSALRKVARIRLTNQKCVTAYIPGQGHNIQKYSAVMLRGGYHKDCPGVHYSIMRGLLDAAPLFNMRKKRSKYGVKLVK